jgi:hypothetical protein
MEMQTPPPPPKNSQFSTQQAMQMFEQQLQQAEKEGIPRQTFIQLGEFARKAISDKTLFPMFKQALMKYKLAPPEMLQKGMDYQMLGLFVALGKVAEKQNLRG